MTRMAEMNESCNCVDMLVSSGQFSSRAVNKPWSYSPGAARRYAPPADGSSKVAKIVADLRRSADESTVRTSLVAGGG